MARNTPQDRTLFATIRTERDAQNAAIKAERSAYEADLACYFDDRMHREMRREMQSNRAPFLSR